MMSDGFTRGTPDGMITLKNEMIAIVEEVMEIGDRTVGIDGGFFVEQGSDEISGLEDDDGASRILHGDEWTIDLLPCQVPLKRLRSAVEPVNTIAAADVLCEDGRIIRFQMMIRPHDQLCRRTCRVLAKEHSVHKSSVHQPGGRS